jgi:dihydroneopterin aldolase
MKFNSNAVIHIKDLKIQALIGTQAHEREASQELLVNIFFEYDASLVLQSDALGHAVDYASIHSKITTKVLATKFFLLERLAAFILDIIMEDSKVSLAEVILEKFGALPGAASVSVKISAQRTDPKLPITSRCC